MAQADHPSRELAPPTNPSPAIPLFAGLDALRALRRTGDEAFHAFGEALDIRLLYFWQWACSGICGNALRGLLAEYLVAQAVRDPSECRVEWDACDVRSPRGSRIEVKSSGYLQSWKQARLSTISFDIGAKLAWSAETNTSAAAPLRSSDLYVFALHKHQDKATVDPLDVAQWEFYLVPTATITAVYKAQKQLRLSSLKRIAPRPVSFAELGPAIAQLEATLPASSPPPAAPLPGASAALVPLAASPRAVAERDRD